MKDDKLIAAEAAMADLALWRRRLVAWDIYNAADREIKLNIAHRKWGEDFVHEVAWRKDAGLIPGGLDGDN